MIPGDGFVQRMPQQLDFVVPRAVDRQKQELEFRVVLQPFLCDFTFVNDVVINNQRNGFGTSVASAQRSE